MLIRCKVPDEDCYAFILAGCRSVGVGLVALAVTNSNLMGKTLAGVRGKHEFQLILKGEVRPKSFIIREETISRPVPIYDQPLTMPKEAYSADAALAASASLAKAASSRTARSAKTLRSSSTPARWRPSMSRL